MKNEGPPNLTSFSWGCAVLCVCGVVCRLLLEIEMCVWDVLWGSEECVCVCVSGDREDKVGR